MKINRTVEEQIVALALIVEDEKVTLKERGLFLSILMRGGIYSSEEITKTSKDGRESVLSALQKLEKSGYLKRGREAFESFRYELVSPAFPPLKL